MPYNRYQSIQGYDPSPQEANWLGGMAYNPYSSGTDWGFMLRNSLNNLLAHKQGQEEQRRAEEELRRKAELEEREYGLEQQKARAAIRESGAHADLYSAQALEALGKKDRGFKMNPIALRSLGTTLGLPKEVTDGVDAMSPEAQEDFFKNSLTSLSQLRKEQMVQAGPLADAAAERSRLAREKVDQAKQNAVLKRQGGVLSAVITLLQQMRQPLYKQIEAVDRDRMIIDAEERGAAKQPFQSALDNIDQAAGEIAAYSTILGMGQELSDEALAKIKRYLSNSKKIKSGEIWQEETPAQAPWVGPWAGPEITYPNTNPPMTQPSLGQQLQMAPAQTPRLTLPPEVMSYMQNHPGADLATVLQKYQEYMKRGKK